MCLIKIMIPFSSSLPIGLHGMQGATPQIYYLHVALITITQSDFLLSVMFYHLSCEQTHMRVPQISEHQICFSLTADSVNLSGWRFNLSSDLKEHTQIILSRIHMLIAFTKIRRKNLRNSFTSIRLFVFFTSSFHLWWSLSVHNLINWT